MTDSPSSNAHEFSVSELAGAVKRNLEDEFGNVRVRGELGRVTIARSGHVYMDLKDERAVISSIVWKGVASRLSFRPEEGLEVIAEGKLSTYPGRSQYQLIIHSLEPAGEGALMALLEERRKKLAAEGLFADQRKQALPYLPKVIGVVTSPTGAVIRDILHRLEDRFPVRVLLWPVLVQGDKAAEQVSSAIAGFDSLPRGGKIPRPDLVIVARGGGSVEDLWSFNEEAVVRAAFACTIPVISAIGHETDWTLLDMVADMRAPTPTGAAEMAVPVRAELAQLLGEQDQRLKAALRRLVQNQETSLKAAIRGLPRPEELLGQAAQKFDHAAHRLGRALQVRVERAQHALQRAMAGFRPAILQQGLLLREKQVEQVRQRVQSNMKHDLQRKDERLAASAKLLKALSHTSVLGRGFALVRDEANKLVSRAAGLSPGQEVNLEFADGRKNALIHDGRAQNRGSSARSNRTSGTRRASKPKPKAGNEPEQGDLF